MKNLALTFLLLLSIFAIGSEIDLSTELQIDMVKNESKLIQLFKENYDGLEIEIDWTKAKCLATKSEIGLVGTCMVNAKIVNDMGTAVISFNKASSFAGTGNPDPEYSFNLIDYTL